MFDLPLEIREKIFSDCQISEIQNIALTCSTLNKELKKTLFYAVSIPREQLIEGRIGEEKLVNLVHTKILTLDDMRTANMTEAERDNLLANNESILEYCNPNTLCMASSLPKSEQRIKFISQFRNLLELDILGIEDLTFESFQSSQSLKVLTISHSKLSDNGSVTLGNLISLEELYMPRCKIYSGDLSSVGRLVQLKVLDLNHCSDGHGFGGMDFPELTGLNMLKDLDISHCLSISDNDLSSIGDLSSLEYLNIMGCCHISDIGMTSLSQLSLLKTLRMNGLLKLTDLAISILGNLANLKELEIFGTDMTDQALSYMVDNFPSLQFLDIRDISGISDMGLEYLALMQSLNKLYWGRNGITEDGLREHQLSRFIEGQC